MYIKEHLTMVNDHTLFTSFRFWNSKNSCSHDLGLYAWLSMLLLLLSYLKLQGRGPFWNVSLLPVNLRIILTNFIVITIQIEFLGLCLDSSLQSLSTSCNFLFRSPLLSTCSNFLFHLPHFDSFNHLWKKWIGT